MVTINLTLNNFSELPVLLDLFARFGNDYKYTTRGIFRRKIPPACPICCTPMVHNGYNSYTKQGPGAPATNNPIESYYSKSLKTDNKKQFRTDISLSEVAERIDFS